jgi:hypothetical protein
MPSTNAHGPKRAILYARVATNEHTRSGFSLAQQLEACEGTLAIKATVFSRRSPAPDRVAPAWSAPEYGWAGSGYYLARARRLPRRHRLASLPTPRREASGIDPDPFFQEVTSPATLETEVFICGFLERDEAEIEEMVEAFS